MSIAEVARNLANVGLQLDKYSMAKIKVYKKILKSRESR